MRWDFYKAMQLTNSLKELIDALCEEEETCDPQDRCLSDEHYQKLLDAQYGAYEIDEIITNLYKRI